MSERSERPKSQCATYAVTPLVRPPDVTMVLPGSKSITNRALVCAAMATGTSRLNGVLIADDTEAMAECLQRLGATIEIEGDQATVAGVGGRLPTGQVSLDARLSGTTARFVLPVLAGGSGRYLLDGAPPLRARPMGPLLDGLRSIGANVQAQGEPGGLPVVVSGGRMRGAAITVTGDVSSQFLSGLLLAAPIFPRGLRVQVGPGLVSRPYVAMTVAVMASFGVEVETVGEDLGSSTYTVARSVYRATSLAVEPDASTASYFFAAAAITGGRVTVPGLGPASLQGDLAFVDVLEEMGAQVERGTDSITVIGKGALHGVDVDLGNLSDTAQTLAAVAVFADSPTRIRGIGFIRAKETDRLAATATELRRCGIQAEEHTDGLTVHPGTPRPATIRTYADHRMAMSFALLGLRADGIEIAEPGCVAKTFPGFWRSLEGLAG